jgi:hypothetical protein
MNHAGAIVAPVALASDWLRQKSAGCGENVALQI